MNCPKCGRELHLDYNECEQVHDRAGFGQTESISEIIETDCECGECYDYEPEGVGIRELLEDAGYDLDDEGYFEEVCSDENSYDCPESVNLKLIDEDYAKPSPLLKYFIRGERPAKFKPFTLWDGTEIK